MKRWATALLAGTATAVAGFAAMLFVYGRAVMPIFVSQDQRMRAAAGLFETGAAVYLLVGVVIGSIVYVASRPR